MGTCECCGKSLSGSEVVEPWEDGNNPHAYIKCRHCGHKNIRYGWGSDDD